MIEQVRSVSSLFTTSGPAGATMETSIAGSAAQTAMQPAAQPPMSFAAVLGDVATDAVNAMRLSETKSFEAIQGKASTREVVDAVMNAEQALQTAISIRDKVVTAYLEVARMQI